MAKLIRQSLRFLAGVLVLVFVVIVVAWLIRGMDARNKPALALWHTQSLKSEFHASDYPDGISFEQYRQIEARLDTELEETVYSKIDPGERGQFNRYDKTSLVFAGASGQKWNRSFERYSENPVGGILLLHGASDSPYSVRALSELFSKQGLYVLALRLPGNGTIPSGLSQASLDDWLAITRMGAAHVRYQVGPDLPLYLGGYSVGAALVLDYTLDALADTSLAMPERLFLYSPAIGITRYARFSAWDVALSMIPFFEKLAWMSIQPEFDPYKYNSFAKNAGHITYLLTSRLHNKILASMNSSSWQGMPPIASFQSLVDSTVFTGSLVSELYLRLPKNGSELVLFDVNRASDLQRFVRDDDRAMLDQLHEGQATQFSFTLVTNRTDETGTMQARTRLAGEENFSVENLGSTWPPGVYSLSHVAIPFKMDDPWYGAGTEDDGQHKFLIGTVAPRGEQGVLTVPIAQMMRLRHNPFFDYVAQRTSNFCTVCRQVETGGYETNSQK